MKEEKTYLMEYTCYNCRTKHIVKIPFGYKSTHYPSKCPYCGNNGSYDFGKKKPQINHQSTVRKEGR